MAALRHAAMRLCERVLQRSHRVSPARMPMSTSSSIKGGKPRLTLEELDKQLEKIKKERDDCLEVMERKARESWAAARISGSTNTNFQNSQPRHYGTTARMITGFGALSLVLGPIYYYTQRNSSEAKIDSLTPQENDVK